MQLSTCASCGAILQDHPRCVICGGEEAVPASSELAPIPKPARPRTKLERRQKYQRGGAIHLRVADSDRDAYEAEQAQRRRSGTFLAGVLALCAVAGATYVLDDDLSSEHEMSVPVTIAAPDHVLAADTGAMPLPDDWSLVPDPSGSWMVPMPNGVATVAGAEGTSGLDYAMSTISYHVEAPPSADPVFGADDRARVSSLSSTEIDARRDRVLETVPEGSQVVVTALRVGDVDGLLFDVTHPNADRTWVAVIPTRDAAATVTMTAEATAVPEVTFDEWVDMFRLIG